MLIVISELHETHYVVFSKITATGVKICDIFQIY